MTIVDAPLDPSLLGDIAARLAAEALPWEQRAGNAPTERCYERILRTDTHEAWLIHWPVGAELDLHDHGNSSGAFPSRPGRLEGRRLSAARACPRRACCTGTTTALRWLHPSP